MPLPVDPLVVVDEAEDDDDEPVVVDAAGEPVAFVVPDAGEPDVAEKVPLVEAPG